MSAKLRLVIVACAMSAIALEWQQPMRGILLQRPTFSTTTTLVEVSAVVTRLGESVPDLLHFEVEVRDEGQVQPIVMFEYVGHADTREGRPPLDVVLVLDDLNISPRLTQPAMDLAELLIAGLGEKDRLTIVNTSPFTLAQEASTDRDQSRRTVKRLRGLKRGAAIVPMEATFRAETLLAAVRDVGRTLSAEGPGQRRTVMVISEGQPLGPTDISVMTSGSLEQDHGRILTTFRETLEAAALANMSIYTVDPRGLAAPTPGLGSSERSAMEMAAGTGRASADEMAATVRGMLWTLADRTGGTLIANRNLLGAGVGDMLRDARGYYRIAYLQPAVGAGETGKLRSIEIRVKREGVSVRARRLYMPQ